MRLIGLVPQELNFNMFEKPLDILVNYAGFYGIARADALVRAEEELRRAQLWDKAQLTARTLSGGMKRRLMIARAMMTRPRLLILDELTAGVDIEIRRDRGKTPDRTKEGEGKRVAGRSEPGGRDIMNK